jgi:hypothetical protein
MTVTRLSLIRTGCPGKSAYSFPDVSRDQRQYAVEVNHC